MAATLSNEGHSSSPSSSSLPPLPRAAILSHDHPDLRSPTFSPSSLLCSLLPNSISSIATQLTAYDEDISAELQAVVDAEYRDFVDLASRLAGERQRIDRLANWADGTGQEGLEGVRRQVDKERQHVEKAQGEVQDLIQSRQVAEERKRHLQLLLAYADALHRLESLMAIEPPSESAAARSPLERRRSSVATLFDVSAQEYDEEDDEDGDIDALAAANSESDDDDDSSSEDAASLPHPQKPHTNGSAFTQPPSQAESSASSTRRIDLPTRITRAKSSWESLAFLKSAALTIATDTSSDEPALMPFLQAHQDRVAAVERSIKADLCDLLARLLLPGSLLVHPVTARSAANPDLEDLQRWSQVPSGLSAEDLRRAQVEERKAWLALVLDTWLRISETAEAGVAELQGFVRQKTVRAWAQSRVRPEALSSGGGNQAGEHTEDRPELRALWLQSEKPVPVEDLFNQTLRYLDSLRDLTTVMDQYELHAAASGSSTKPVSKPTRPLQPLESIYWPELSQAFTERLGHHLFFVGRLDDFHRNYTTTQRFLDSVERLAPSRRAAKAWRSHPAYVSFNKRWQLSVYFQMRFREVVSGYEQGLESSSAAATASSTVAVKVPLLKATQAAVEAFVAPWRADCHLQPLLARQWRLSLMIVSRYHAWLEEQLPSGMRSRSNVDSPALPRGSFDGRPGAAAGADHGETYAQDEKTLKTLVILVADALWFQAEVTRRLQSVVAPTLPRSGEDDEVVKGMAAEMQRTLDETFPFTRTLLPAISSRLTAILKSRCAEPLRLVRSVSSTSYRTSGSNTPTDGGAASSAGGVEPSYFVPQILRSLRHFLGKGDRPDEKFLTAATLVDGEVKTAWATAVVDDVAVRYAASLTQMIQNYESLKRLKRGTAGGGGSGGGGFGGLASSLLGRSKSQQSGAGDAGRDLEGERMHAQMRADVERLEMDVKGLEQVGVTVDLEKSDAWQSLRDVVKARA